MDGHPEIKGHGITSSSSPTAMQIDDIQKVTFTTRGDKQYSVDVGNDWRQRNDGATSSTTNHVADAVIHALTAGNWQDMSVVNSPDAQHEYSPQMSEPKDICVSSSIQSYITCATREYRGEMIELSVYCIGKEVKIWYINTPSFQHSGRDITAVDLASALTDLSSWLQDIAKPLLFVGCTELICLLKSITQRNACDNFKSIVEGFTFTDKNKLAFKDMIGKSEIITLEKEKNPGISVLKLSAIIETKMGTNGRGEILEILAKNSRTFNNALDLSIYRVKVEENLNSEFENKSLATLMNREKLRKDVGKKMASVGLTYKDICMIYRSFKSLVGIQPNKMMYQVFQDRKITTSTGRVDEVIAMLENHGN